MKSLFLTILMLVPTVAFSAPSISTVSGNFGAGQEITIKGSGFGSSGPNVVLFDDFSKGAAGQTHSSSAIIGNWAQAKCIVFADSMLSGGQGARCVGSPGQLTNKVIFPSVTQEVFVSSIAYVPNGYKFPYATQQESFPTKSALKHFWLMYNTDGHTKAEYPDIVSPSWTGSTFYTIASNDTGMSQYDMGSSVAWTWDKPIRWTLWAKGNGSSSSGTDGMFQAVNPSKHDTKDYTNYKAWFKSEHTVKGWDRVNLIGYTRSASDFNDGHNWVIDDVYVATGQNAAARIEIGNNSNYKSCTKLAISTPTNWSSTSIKANLRLGGFNKNDDAYVFVVDGNNNYSQGYKITLNTEVVGGEDPVEDPVEEPLPAPVEEPLPAPVITIKSISK